MLVYVVTGSWDYAGSTVVWVGVGPEAGVDGRVDAYDAAVAAAEAALPDYDSVEVLMGAPGTEPREVLTMRRGAPRPVRLRAGGSE